MPGGNRGGRSCLGEGKRGTGGEVCRSGGKSSHVGGGPGEGCRRSSEADGRDDGAGRGSETGTIGKDGVGLSPSSREHFETIRGNCSAIGCSGEAGGECQDKGLGLRGTVWGEVATVVRGLSGLSLARYSPRVGT